jgi:hypothetical protein
MKSAFIEVKLMLEDFIVELPLIEQGLFLGSLIVKDQSLHKVFRVPSFAIDLPYPYFRLKVIKASSLRLDQSLLIIVKLINFMDQFKIAGI